MQSHSLQNKETPVPEQSERIRMPLQELRDRVSIEEPLNSLKQLLIVDEVSVAHLVTGNDGMYLVRRGEVTKFLEVASFSAEADSRDLTFKERVEVERNVAELVLQTFLKISEFLRREVTSARMF